MAIGARHADRSAIAQAVTLAVAIVIGVMPGVRTGVAIMLGVAIVTRVVPIAPAAFPIGRIRREVARTAIGRALVRIVILMHRRGGPVFLLRVGQPLIGGAAAAGRKDRLRSHVDRRGTRAIGLPARRARTEQ